MKTILLIGLVIELIVGGIFMLGLLSPNLTRADTEPNTEDPGLVQLLPDIGKIYRAALTTPLQEVEHEIHDKEIAEFYHRLLQKYELDEP